MLRSLTLASATLLVAAGKMLQGDSEVLVQVHHKIHARKADEEQPQAAPAGKMMTVNVRAKATQRPLQKPCAGCYETGFDLTCMGRSLTFVFQPNTPMARVDGKMAAQNLGWKPAMDVEHTMTVIMRSSDIHTFRISDGQDGSMVWEKDFHHTGWFPVTNRDRTRCRVKTIDHYWPLNRPTNRVKCYDSASETHCLHMPEDFAVVDEPAPYQPSGLDRPRVAFQGCRGYGDPHYNPFRGGKMNFQGKGAYWLSVSADPDLMAQTYNCPMVRQGKATVAVATAIKIRDTTVSISTMGGPVVKVNGEVQPKGLNQFRPSGVEVDIGPRAIVVKGATDLNTNEFGEVKVMVRRSSNSPTGYILAIFTYLPAAKVPSSTGICVAADKAAAAAEWAGGAFLWPVDDFNALEGACCATEPTGSCSPPLGGNAEPEPTAEEMCAACPTITKEQAEFQCIEFQRANQTVLYNNCIFDLCATCDPLEALDQTETEFSEEVDGNPIAVNGRLTPVGAMADPHCKNVRDESFDIRARGHMEMIEIPRLGDARGSSLDVSALISPIHNDLCSPTVIKRLDIRGGWLPSRLSLSLHPSTTGLVPDIPKAWQEWMEQPHAKDSNVSMLERRWKVNGEDRGVLWIQVHDLSMKIHQRRGTRSGEPYFDVEVTGLQSYGKEAGGLLGLDSHREVERPVLGCDARDEHHHSPVVRLDRAKGEKSAQEAELFDARLLSTITAF